MNAFLFIVLLSGNLFASSKAEVWRDLYNQAHQDSASHPKKSCETFLDLSKQLDFPMRKVAFLRTLSVCESKSDPDWKAVHQFAPEPWLAPMITEQKFLYFRSHKKYWDAYQIGKKSKRALKLMDQDLVELAQKALKLKMSKANRRQLEKELFKRAPRLLPHPKRSQYLSVAKDFRNAREFKKAHLFYDKVIASKHFSSVQKWYAYKGKRRTYKLRRWQKMTSYIDASKKWAQFLNSSWKKSKKLTRLHHKAGITYVRTLWTEKGQKSAVKELTKLETALKGHFSMQTVYWLKAKMAEENGDTQGTLKWLEASSQEASISKSDTQRGLWNLAWNQRRNGLFSQSTKNLDRLLKDKDLSFYELTKYKYWQAQNLRDEKNESQSLRAFEKLIDMDPFGFYGALAHRALQRPLVKIQVQKIADKDLWSLFSGANDYQTFNWLIDINETKVAQKFLSLQVKTQKNWDSVAWTKYLLLMQKSKNYVGFFTKFHTRKPTIQAKIYKNAPYLLFPMPFESLVTNVASQSQVDAALIYSIMKQESGFDPQARSFADAFGLMQLLPQVAKKTATEVPNSPYKTATDLFKPKVNIALGAQTLKSLFSGFNDQFILSVAAYNASKTAVRGWVKSRYSGDPITFIEDIPYEETKGYVKLVLRNFISYSRFMNPDQDLDFPEGTLQGLNQFKN